MYLGCGLGLIEDGVCRVNEDLEKLALWAKTNGLALNPSKSKCLVISKKILDLTYFPQVTLNNTTVEYVNSARNLGIIFTRNLTWDKHINGVVGKAYGTLRMLWVSQSYTPIKTRAMLAKSLILPILVYGCEIFSSCNYACKRKLNVVFNNIIRYIFGLRRYDRVSNFSNCLLSMSLEKYFQFRTLSLLSDILFTTQPPYLFERITRASSARSDQLIQPRYASLTSEHQFFINASRLWNSLPRHIKRTNNNTHFKTQLKQFLSVS